MNRGTRAGLLAVAVIILVVAFVALRPSADDPETTADAPTATPTVADTPASEAELEEETPTPSPTPKPTVDPGPLLTGSKVQKIRVDKGETVRFRVRSPQAEEVHIHGYDIMKDVKAGQTVRISFKATIDGIFEIEFEHAAKQIAELRVDP
jgi:FtsP/CotA-like multicopper oxidase with cupredoxin domain